MKKILSRQLGFTLIEVLVASFIFASVLAVVYGLLNDTLISKKELELNLTVNEQVKNANEVLQTVMRQANGDFFTDGEFGTTPTTVPPRSAHLFFISRIPANPIIDSIPSGWNSLASGKNLYVKVDNDAQKEIYAFYFKLDAGTYYLYLQSWKKLPQDTKWSQDQPETKLLDCATGDMVFETPKQADGVTPKSVYNPTNGDLPPMDLYVHLQITAKSQTSWKSRFFEREMDQIYVPLITSNPYL
jgi:prepilin-type N-terminal cleavage/methylation domain-containing protein